MAIREKKKRKKKRQREREREREEERERRERERKREREKRESGRRLSCGTKARVMVLAMVGTTFRSSRLSQLKPKPKPCAAALNTSSGREQGRRRSRVGLGLERFEREGRVVARAQQGVGLVETPLTGELIAEIEESACLDMAGRLQKVELALPDMNATVDVSFVGPKDDKSKAKDGKGEKPAIVMVHGFDSSCLEFRRLFPILEEDFEVYAVDVLGWGFTDSKGQDCGPKYKGAAVSESVSFVSSSSSFSSSCFVDSETQRLTGWLFGE